MEIRIYKSMQHFNANKPMYVACVSCPDAFDFSASLRVFESIYGPDVVIIFMCV